MITENLGKKEKNNCKKKIVWNSLQKNASKTMDCEHFKYFWKYDYIFLLVSREQFS
jgi:hypothetical protein